MKLNKKVFDRQRREFLLTFFSQKVDRYEEKEIHGFWLVKHYNGNTGNWQVAIFDLDKFAHYKEYHNKNLNLFQ